MAVQRTQNGVHLAYKGVPDFGGTVRDGYAILGRNGKYLDDANGGVGSNLEVIWEVIVVGLVPVRISWATA